MSDIYDISVFPHEVNSHDVLERELVKSGKKTGDPFYVIKESIDARKRPAVIRLRCVVGEHPPTVQKPIAKNVENAPEVFVIGSGPCGLFAAIRLIERGLKPIIIERGKDVRTRRRDLAKLNKEQVVNPESNYCFGEGGAGTYSDGKLYTRSKKRGSVDEVLNFLVAFGASPDILVKAHPHIGTNKLPQVITKIREHILDCGGEVRFDTKLTDLKTADGSLKIICLNGDEWVNCNRLILATGHSARDIFELLHRRTILIESKPFALGVRIEHPQSIIDQAQYKCAERGEYLPPASYSLVHQADGLGVYSFCMCPGGIIAPCATATEEIVTNGWSPSKRNNPYANSGIVVSITAEEYDAKGTGNPLLALEYQKNVERAAWRAGGGGQVAPAQRMMDFIHKKVSTDLPKCSYQPGLNSAELREVLPATVHRRLAEAMKAFGKKMRGYGTNEAVLVATESRTSSPVRIPRNELLEHPQVKGLFPGGEGAGYAGGIVSAAIDGMKVAESLADKVKATA
ncbi:MAG: FAD-binding protein [Cryomorphaceae bacterium]